MDCLTDFTNEEIKREQKRWIGILKAYWEPSGMTKKNYKIIRKLIKMGIVTDIECKKHSLAPISGNHTLTIHLKSIHFDF